MIDPIIFSFDINFLNLTLNVTWYGVFIAVAVLIGYFITEREIKWRGGDEDYLIDLLLWIMIYGIIGARLGYVLNDTLGGSTYFLDNPVRILKIWEGGLHIYGAIALAAYVALRHAKRYGFDRWILVDSVAPVLFISQAIGRIGNFINQELYGPPTDLPWGVSIAAENRIAPWNDLIQYPLETTRFHPTYFYEMAWNLLAAVLILWLARKLGERFKPGTAFYTWMLLEGIGRFWIEYFRPDQPVIDGTAISFSRIAATLLALAGALLLLQRYEKIRIPSFSPGPEKYLMKDKKWKKKDRRR